MVGLGVLVFILLQPRCSAVRTKRSDRPSTFLTAPTRSQVTYRVAGSFPVVSQCFPCPHTHSHTLLLLPRCLRRPRHTIGTFAAPSRSPHTLHYPLRALAVLRGPQDPSWNHRSCPFSLSHPWGPCEGQGSSLEPSQTSRRLLTALCAYCHSFP